MSQPIFTDGIADIMVIGGVVRIEFFVVTPNRDAGTTTNDGPSMMRVPALTVAMPLPGFAGSLQLLDDVRKKMLAEGVLKARLDEPNDAASAKVKSKNFS